MNDLLAVGLILLGMLVGAVLTWLLARGKMGAEIAAAVARSEAAVNTELSQMRERVRAGDENRKTEQVQSEKLQQQTEKWRTQLDEASNTIAKLDERASRVAELENQISQLRQMLEDRNAELRCISEELAQRSQQAQSLSQQVTALQDDCDGLKKKLEKASADLFTVNERKTAFEEQANRVRELEQSVKNAQGQLETTCSELARERQVNGAEVVRLRTALSGEQTAHELVVTELADLKRTHAVADREVARLTTESAELRTLLDAERDAHDEKMLLLTEAKQSLTEQFKNLANDILEEKSKRFAEQNQSNMGLLLDPLKTQLNEFKGKVEEVYVQEGKDRSALAEQVRQLMGLNQSLSQDAKNLTTALKGNAKTQGNWGELILSRVLEQSGLEKGREYHVQESHKREDDSRAQPDVVIYLPEERRLVVDSKVSLVAYDEHARGETDEERQVALQRHLTSVRGHIRDLSTKQYEKLYGLKSLDFVLMFIPIEPAFHLAISGDDSLFMDGWEKNVLLVSPSTLLFVVRTVAHLWRQEAQSRNAQDIAKRGAELYDKLVDFVKDVEGIGKKLREAQDGYDSAHKRLATGKGNVIRQAEMLRDLGVKPSKSLSVAMVDSAMVDEDIAVMRTLSNIAALDTPREVAD